MGNDGDKDLGLFGSECEDEGTELIGGTSIDTKTADATDTAGTESVGTEKAKTGPGVLKLLSDETGTRLRKTLGMFVPEFFDFQHKSP